MTTSGQELLTRGATHPSPWRSERASGVSETVTPSARPAFGPERREVTLEVSRGLLERPWFRETLKRLLRLMALRDNWNGYGERAVHEGAVKRAMNVLKEVGVEGPPPDVVPTADGGVQLEWAGAGWEIEVEVPPVGLAAVFIVDPSGDELELVAGARNQIWEQLRMRIAAMGAATA